LEFTTSMPYEIHDISEKQVKFGLWFIKNKPNFINIGKLLLLIWCVLSIGYGIYGLTIHFIEIGKLNESLKTLVTTNINFEKFRLSMIAKPLSISEPTIIYSGNNRYDIFVQVVNPNTNFSVKKLTYWFEGAGLTTKLDSVYILPGQKVMLTSLGNLSQERISQVRLRYQQPEWHRIQPSDNFPKIDIGLSTININQPENSARSWISFTATNNTVYNFREVRWQALIYSNDQIIGINEVLINDFASGQNREVSLSWFDKLPRISQAEVWPIIDLNNSEVLYKIPGKVESLPDL
jgi:hypothetical protein